MSHLNASNVCSSFSSNASFRPTFIANRNRSQRHSSFTRSNFNGKSCNSSMYTYSKINLEECVNKIESILDDPGISTLLNQEQTRAISTLRENINQCQHLLAPRDSASSSMIPAQVLEDLDSINSAFLASTYGGLKLSGSTCNFESILSESSPLVDPGLYVPEEWQKLSLHTKIKLAEILSLKNLNRWGFNVLDVVKNVEPGSVLVLVGWAIIASPDAQKVMMSSISQDFEEEENWGGYNFSSCLGVDYKKMVAFLRSTESQYDVKGKYHNNIHAADVTQTLHSMIQIGGDELSGTLNMTDIYSMLLAAAAHDIGHPGTNNAYQINKQTNLALVYNDQSPLENMHASKASQLIKSLGVFENFSTDQQQFVRKRMISAILATDMSLHFKSVSFMEEFITRYEEDGVFWYDYVQEGDFGAIQAILDYMIHLADISNPTKPQPVAVYWAECALAEFFFQGDLEKKDNLPVSPLCDRDNTNLATSQRDFIKYVILPSYGVLGRLLPGVQKHIMPQIEDNLRYWESRIE